MMFWVNRLQLETARTHIAEASGILVNFEVVIHLWFISRYLCLEGLVKAMKKPSGHTDCSPRFEPRTPIIWSKRDYISEQCLTISSLTQCYCLKFCDRCEVFSIYVSLDIFCRLRIAASNECNKLCFILFQVMETSSFLNVVLSNKTEGNFPKIYIS
jgi:hypothetical protein